MEGEVELFGASGRQGFSVEIETELDGNSIDNVKTCFHLINLVTLRGNRFHS